MAKFTATKGDRSILAAALVVLLVGLGNAVVIYVTAEPEPEYPPGYYSVITKRDLRQMEQFGGKANILASDIREWFFGLWHGRSLAFTIAVISIFLSWAIWFVATRPAPGTDQSESSTMRGRNP